MGEWHLSLALMKVVDRGEAVGGVPVVGPQREDIRRGGVYDALREWRGAWREIGGEGEGR